MEPKDATKQVFTANLMPSRGSWLELEIDKKGIVYARIDRKRKLPITTLLRAPRRGPVDGFQLDTSSNEAILNLFDESTASTSRTRSRRTSTVRRRPSSRSSKQRPVSRRRSTTRGTCSRSSSTQALRPHEGRPLQAQPAARRRGAGGHASSRPRTSSPSSGASSTCRPAPVPEDARTTRRGGRSPARADPRRLDEYEHFGNRRLRTTGELIERSGSASTAWSGSSASG